MNEQCTFLLYRYISIPHSTPPFLRLKAGTTKADASFCRCLNWGEQKYHMCVFVTHKKQDKTNTASSWASPFSGIVIAVRQKRCWVFHGNFSSMQLPLVAQSPKKHWEQAFKTCCLSPPWLNLAFSFHSTKVFSWGREEIEHIQGNCIQKGNVWTAQGSCYQTLHM